RRSARWAADMSARYVTRDALSTMVFIPHPRSARPARHRASFSAARHASAAGGTGSRARRPGPRARPAMPASALRRPGRPTLPRYLGSVSRRPPPSRRIRPTPDPPAGWRCPAAPLREGIASGRGTFFRVGRSWLLSGGLGDGGDGLLLRQFADAKVRFPPDAPLALAVWRAPLDPSRKPFLLTTQPFGKRLTRLQQLRRGGDQAGVGLRDLAVSEASPIGALITVAWENRPDCHIGVGALN